MKGTGWIETWATKSNVLVVSLLYVLAVYFLEIKDAPAGCDNWCVRFSADLLLPFFFPAVVIAIFSFITYFLPNQIFKTWIKFAVWWTLLSAAWVILTPHESGADWIGLDQKLILSLSLSVLFFGLSTLVVLFRSVRFYRHKK